MADRKFDSVDSQLSDASLDHSGVAKPRRKLTTFVKVRAERYVAITLPWNAISGQLSDTAAHSAKVERIVWH